ncbi:MAG: type III pantothenate kinase [Sedimentisphaerales bacterium]|nr:type III pantothenate kinase [Sedimentisphaerales bacterium]
MNIIAIDIGNTNIHLGLFLDGEETSIEPVPGDNKSQLAEVLERLWEQIPVLESSKEQKRDGVIVLCSVKPKWAQTIRELCAEKFSEKVLVIGDDIPLPMPALVDEPLKIGTDRIVEAFAAYSVVEGAVVVADFGTALTIDLVDANGAFQGGVICPGFAIEARSLKDGTAQLPEVTVTRPTTPYGKNTNDAINCGLYYATIGTLEEVIRRYAESIGMWPQTILTGAAAATIKEDCPFIDNYVPNLAVKGIVLTYKKYIEDKSRN